MQSGHHRLIPPTVAAEIGVIRCADEVSLSRFCMRAVGGSSPVSGETLAGPEADDRQGTACTVVQERR